MVHVSETALIMHGINSNNYNNVSMSKYAA